MNDNHTKPQPVLVASIILAMVTFVVGGLSALGVDPQIVGVCTLALGALNLGAGLYVRGLVVPFADTAAYKNNEGVVVAGPATETINGAPVTVAPE